MAVSICIAGLGTVLMFLPHYITGKYEFGQSSENVCNPAGSVDSCANKDETINSRYAYIFIAAKCLMGIGSATYLTVGVALLDDSVNPQNTPLYIAITQMLYLFGPLLGFVVGGALLDIYVDFDSVPKEEWSVLQVEDPRWVGAWWLGFVLSAILLFISAIPFFFFGAELPTAKAAREAREEAARLVTDDATTGNTAPATPPTLGKRLTLKDFGTMTWSLIRNPVFMMVTFGYTLSGLVLLSMATFSAKIIQNQFNLPQSTAALFFGAATIPFSMIGLLSCGLFMRKKNVSVSGALLLLVILAAITTAGHTSLLLYCDQSTLVGYNTPYQNTSASVLNLYSDCNLECSCDTDPYEPVCDTEGTRYYSPCLAGCLLTNDSGKSYQNCSCLPSSIESRVVSFKNCPEERCSLMIAHLALIAVSAFTYSATIVPVYTAILRTCQEHERSFALGILGFIVRALGIVPGPVLFGLVIDAACSKWGEVCGERTSCWIYDKADLSRNLTLFAMIITAVKTLCFLLAWKIHKPPEKQSPSAEIYIDGLREKEIKDTRF